MGVATHVSILSSAIDGTEYHRSTCSSSRDISLFALLAVCSVEESYWFLWRSHHHRFGQRTYLAGHADHVHQSRSQQQARHCQLFPTHLLGYRYGSWCLSGRHCHSPYGILFRLLVRLHRQSPWRSLLFYICTRALCTKQAEVKNT